MFTRRLLGVLTTLAALLASAFTTILVTQAGANGDPIMEAAAPESAQILPAADLVPDNENEFVSMRPCRLVDTRQTQPLAVGVTVTFRSRDPLTSQGGNPAGCGIPTGVVSLAVNLTAVSSAGNGFLRAWETGQTQPTATLLGYTNIFNATNGVVIPVNATPSASFDVQAFASGTHLVVDVFGYYTAPLGGAIALDGSIIPGHGESRIVSSERISSGPNNGKYLVTFDRSIEKCNAFVTPVNQNRIASVAFAGSVATVTLNDTTGAVSGGPFFIVADC